MSEISKNNKRKLSFNFVFQKSLFILSFKEKTELLDPRRILNWWIAKHIYEKKSTMSVNWNKSYNINGSHSAELQWNLQLNLHVKLRTRVLENMSSCIWYNPWHVYTNSLRFHWQSHLYALSNWFKSVEKRVIPTYWAQQPNCFTRWYAVVPFQITVEI